MLLPDVTGNELSNDRRSSAAVLLQIQPQIAVSGIAMVCLNPVYNPNGNVFPKDCYYLLLNYLLYLSSSPPVFPITSTLSPSPNPAFSNDRGCLLKAPADIITDRMQNAITIVICKLNSLNTFLVSRARLVGKEDKIWNSQPAANAVLETGCRPDVRRRSC
jgi:hypothetical protein